MTELLISLCHNVRRHDFRHACRRSYTIELVVIFLVGQLALAEQTCKTNCELFLNYAPSVHFLTQYGDTLCHVEHGLCQINEIN